jgi:hypothetical protein
VGRPIGKIALGVAGALLLLACGGSYRSDSDRQAGGASGSSGAGAADGTGQAGTALGGACGDGDPQARAGSVTFGLYSNEPVWIRQGCTIEYELSYLCGAESVSVPADPGNSGCFDLTCNDTGTCYACTACPSTALSIASGVVVTTSGWDGIITKPGLTAAGCRCVEKRLGPAGHYRLTISSFLSEEDALADRNGYPHTAAFDLPVSGIVPVNLGFMGI